MTVSTEQAEKPRRDELGRLLPGQPSLNKAGRPRLHEWYKRGSDIALAVQMAAATGVVVSEVTDDPEALAVLRAAAADSSLQQRLEAGREMIARVHGAAKQTVEFGADESITEIIRRVIEPPSRPEKEITMPSARSVDPPPKQFPRS